jgi:hypothetical protein
MATALSTTMVPLHQHLRDTLYDQHVFLEQLTVAMETMRFHPHARQQIPAHLKHWLVPWRVAKG